jgi:hypothetical protein
MGPSIGCGQRASGRMGLTPHWKWAYPAHICTGTKWARPVLVRAADSPRLPATSRPHLGRDSLQRARVVRRGREAPPAVLCGCVCVLACVCACVWACVFVCACMRTYVRTCVCVSMLTHTRARKHTHTHTNTRTHTHTHAHPRTHAHTLDDAVVSQAVHRLPQVCARPRRGRQVPPTARRSGRAVQSPPLPLGHGRTGQHRAFQPAKKPSGLCGVASLPSFTGRGKKRVFLLAARHGTARRLQAGTTTRRIRRSIRSSGRKTLRRRTTGGE